MFLSVPQLFGCGSVAQTVLSKGALGEPLTIHVGFTLGVMMAVYLAGGVSGISSPQKHTRLTFMTIPTFCFHYHSGHFVITWLPHHETVGGVTNCCQRCSRSWCSPAGNECLQAGVWLELFLHHSNSLLIKKWTVSDSLRSRTDSFFSVVVVAILMPLLAYLPVDGFSVSGDWCQFAYMGYIDCVPLSKWDFTGYIPWGLQQEESPVCSL